MALLAAALGAGGASAAPIHWGPRGGVNVSAFTGGITDFFRPDFRYFPNVGLALQVDLARHLAFRTEAAYSAKGGGSEEEITDQAGNVVGTSKSTWRFDYVEIPLLLRAKVPLAAGPTPYLEVGPSFAIAVGGEFDSDAFGSTSLRDDMNDLDVGFGGGFGLELPAGPARAALEVRYTRGFSSLYRDTGGASVINQAWTFAASWMY
jgi:hypothetical protein